MHHHTPQFPKEEREGRREGGREEGRTRHHQLLPSAPFRDLVPGLRVKFRLLSLLHE